MLEVFQLRNTVNLISNAEVSVFYQDDIIFESIRRYTFVL